jgi:hypothetical protein
MPSFMPSISLATHVAASAVESKMIQQALTHARDAAINTYRRIALIGFL